MDDSMEDICARLTLVDALNLVALEFGLERLEEIDFGALSKLLSGFLSERAL